MKPRLNWPQILDNWIVWLPVLIICSDQTVRERESDQTERDLHCETIALSDCQVRLSGQIRQWKIRVRSDRERESKREKERERKRERESERARERAIMLMIKAIEIMFLKEIERRSTANSVLRHRPESKDHDFRNFTQFARSCQAG